MRVKALAYRVEDGYWATIPNLPGAYTGAKTLEELQDNLRKAIGLYLSDESWTNRVQPEGARIVEVEV